MKRSLTVFVVLLCTLFATDEADVYELAISVPGSWNPSFVPSFLSNFFNKRLNRETVTVNIKIIEPFGIEVWTSDTSSIDMLRIQCLGHVSNRTKEIFFSNTTVHENGKFMIKNTDLEIKMNETIFCSASVRQGDELFYSGTGFQKIWNMNECFLWREQRRKSTELENIILACITSHPTELLFFPITNATTYVSDHKMFVESRLWKINGLRLLVNKVVATYLVQHGVVAKMETVRNKCTVLVLGRIEFEVLDADPTSIQESLITQNAEETFENSNTTEINSADQQK